MSDLSSELSLLLLLMLAGGVLATAEVAVSSAQRARLKQLADAGGRRARRTLEIVRNSARFLSALRAGLALIWVLAGALGGVWLTGRLATLFEGAPALAPHGRAVAFLAVAAAIALGAIIFGELLPKRLGLANPERAAVILAPTLERVSRWVSPVVALVSACTQGVFRLFGLKASPTSKPVSEEEVTRLIEQGLHTGVFNKEEKDMVAGVLELDKLPVTAIMTPRPKIVFLNLDDPEEANWRRIVSSGHSYFPVYQGNRDQVLGLVSVKALWAHSAIGLSTSLKNLMVPALVVPETMTAIQLLEAFKKSGRHIALISDEFGSIQGLTTLIDVLEAIVGDLPAQGRRDAPGARLREDGSWLVDATLGIAEVKQLLKLEVLPHEDEADYQTLGGFVMTQFGRIPAAGDRFEHAGWRFEVVDMDRHRVDKVLVSKLAEPVEEQAAG